MDETTVLRCPFCGDPDPRIVQLDTEGWAVVCNECSVVGPVVSTPAEAIRRWNRRAPKSAQFSKKVE